MADETGEASRLQPGLVRRVVPRQQICVAAADPFVILMLLIDFD